MIFKKQYQENKRLPKGQHIHVRRLKQEAAKEDRVYKPAV